MKTLSKILIALIITAAYVGLQPSNGECNVDDKIIAIVNDEVITGNDLSEYMRTIYAHLKTEFQDPFKVQQMMKEIKGQGIYKLINDRLILSEANRMELEVRPIAIENKVNEIKKKYKDDQDFLKALIKNGSTLSDLHNKIEDQLKVQFVIDHEVKSKIFVNPQEITNFYEKHRNEFLRPERINVDSIFISFNDGKEAAQKKAKMIVGQISKGQSFEELAKQHSEAPSVGIIAKGHMLESIENVIFRLQEAETSTPVETDAGIYIFKMKGKIPPSVAELKEVKELIHNRLFQQKFKKRYQKWTEKLKRRAYVEIKG